MQMVDKWDCYVWLATPGLSHFGVDWEDLSPCGLTGQCLAPGGLESGLESLGFITVMTVMWGDVANINVDVKHHCIVHNDIVITEPGYIVSFIKQYSML